MSEDTLRVDRRLDGVAVVLRATGEIDMSTASMLTDEFDQAIVAGAGMVVVDLSGVTFFGSAGIAALLDARERCEESGGSLRLVAANGPVPRSLEIAGVQELLPVFPTLTEATA